MRAFCPMAAAVAASMLPTTEPRAQCGDVSGLTAVVVDAIGSLGLQGAAVQVTGPTMSLYERGFGSIDPRSVVAIASATKWLSAAVVMSLVDDGRLRLDDRIERFLPSFSGPKAAITVRQCFSHTSGLPDQDPILGDRTVTLAQAVDHIATLPLVYAPGTAFLYGGVSMHVVGRVCEVASGESWAALFARRIAGPLAMNATDYQAFGATANPRIAGGARSTLLDYGRFVAMLRDRGRAGATRVLSEAAVDEMFRDVTSGLRVLGTPHPNNAPYGIGTWIEAQDGNGDPLLVSGAGAFGFSAWVDLERRTTGVLSVLDSARRILPYFYRLIDITQDAVPPTGVDCVGASTPSCNGAILLNADAVPWANSAAFGVVGRAAPPQSAGSLLLGTGTNPIGLPLLGVRVHVRLLPLAVLLPIASDGAGAFRAPLPLAGTVRGTGAGAQAVWLNTPSCGGAGTLAASNAIAITVQ